MDLDVDGRALAVVSAGGVLGALTRYAAGVAWPHAAGGFPWSTWSVNVSGCFLIGALLTLLGRFRPGHRLTRLFLGTGVLGGYTTFSTAANDVLRAPAPTGLAYLAATVAGALLAVWAGSSLASLGGPADGKPVSGAPTGERLPSGPAGGGAPR
ncbi:fluoride efflux transporter FluC [Actinoplanes teichomyceticus]|uniref:fluoride efflux transporter FluC n=1 Tax=Actinoplanes teichomyceticus TaxID=1867 RepID=UPI0011EB5050|nr:CrcB family protein [Actinoplanes teichomyceticus]